MFPNSLIPYPKLFQNILIKTKVKKKKTGVRYQTSQKSSKFWTKRRRKSKKKLMHTLYIYIYNSQLSKLPHLYFKDLKKGKALGSLL